MAEQNRLNLDLSKSDQIIAEDILKVLFQIEYDGKQADAALISARCVKPQEIIQKLIHVLIENDYIKRERDFYHLTEKGNKFALMLIRAHRVCETYLARETSVSPDEWHRRAHEMEHRLSFEEINRISDKLGNPRFDPHGDPIPTREGKLPQISGIPLPDWETGRSAIIVHVEDEPETAYKRLAEIGLFPGIRIKIVAKEPSQIELLVEGRAVKTDVCDAISVLVTGLPPDVKEENLRRLSELKPGESAVIHGLLPSCIGLERQRLLDLGIVKGSRITCEFTSAFKSPLAYRVRGALIALRKEQADKVLIVKDDGNTAK
jgi:DtxR family Mn-dependent transcriptional regulator